MIRLATLLLWLGLTSPVMAECRQALALGLDVSGSVDAREYRLQIGGVADYQNKPVVDKAKGQASFMLRHNDQVRSLLDTLKELKIAENTLVVWYSDNGPMYGFWPIAGSSWDSMMTRSTACRTSSSRRAISRT